jgi:hypothetical protein
MPLLLLGIIFVGLSLFLILICVNYSWILWEKDRVNDLTSRIKPSSESDILRKTSERDYTTNFDFRNASKNGIKNAKSAYEKTLMAVKDNKYPKWVKELVELFENLRSNFWKTIKNFITYLLHLAKPSDFADPNNQKFNDTNSETNNSEENTVSQVTASLQKTIKKDEDSEITSLNKVEDENQILQKQKETTVATLNLASKNSSTDEAKSDANSKIEARILQKLQESNLTNYGIWLELGNFYVKTNEPEKAGEIFNLVMNNTKDQAQKDMAVKALIGL